VSIRKIWIVLVMLFVAMSLSSCYWWKDIERDEVGIALYKNEIESCKSAGVYTDGRWYADMDKVSLETMTFSVSDPEVATRDNQLVGITITLQVQRSSECNALQQMFTNWPSLVKDNEAVIHNVTAITREGIKTGTRSFSLIQLLDDRNGLANAISEHVSEDSAKFAVNIINITIENIGLDPAYAQLMNDKALMTAEIDKELRRQDLVEQKAATDALEQENRTIVYEQQLLAEAALTEVEVEIARREGEKTQAAQEVYLLNDKAYNLELMKRMADVFGDQAVIYFVESLEDLTLLLTGQGAVLPLPSTNPGQGNQ